MTEQVVWESDRWLTTVATYVLGDTYMYPPHSKVEYLGGATYSPTGEHVAVFRKAGTSECFIVTADDWAAGGPMTMGDYQDLPVES
jgi:hypothetical protein